MMHKHFFTTGLLLLLSLPAAAGSLPVRQVLSSGSHCVAWRTSKTLALVSQQEVVGTSCQVGVTAQKNADGKFSATVSIPIASFNSQEQDRDKGVLKILKASVQPNLLFSSQALSKSQWEGMLSQGHGVVRGNLSIGGRAFPISAPVKVRKSGNRIELSGIIRTTFSALGITPPEVGPGGAIAKVPDYLELHFNLTSDKVQNIGVIQ